MPHSLVPSHLILRYMHFLLVKQHKDGSQSGAILVCKEHGVRRHGMLSHCAVRLASLFVG